MNTIKEASDRVYSVFLSKDGQDGEKVTTGTLADIVQQMEQHNIVRFSRPFIAYRRGTEERVTCHEWFTDYVREVRELFGANSRMVHQLYKTADEGVQVLELDNGDIFPVISWRRVIPMPHTVENVGNYVHYTMTKEDPSVRWGVKLREVL